MPDAYSNEIVLETYTDRLDVFENIWSTKLHHNYWNDFDNWVTFQIVDTHLSSEDNSYDTSCQLQNDHQQNEENVLKQKKWSLAFVSIFLVDVGGLASKLVFSNLPKLALLAYWTTLQTLCS